MHQLDCDHPELQIATPTTKEELQTVSDGFFLPAQHGLDGNNNNGYLPVPDTIRYPIGAPNSSRRNGVLNRITELQLC
jgi:hypothetical protein